MMKNSKTYIYFYIMKFVILMRIDWIHGIFDTFINPSDLSLIEKRNDERKVSLFIIKNVLNFLIDD